MRASDGASDLRRVSSALGRCYAFNSAMFEPERSGKSRCSACEANIAKGDTMFIGPFTDVNGRERWTRMHVRCALRCSFDALAENLRTSSTTFVGRAEVEAEVHDAHELAKYRALRVARDVSRGDEVAPEVVAAASRIAPRPVDTIALLAHEQWAAGRLLDSVLESLGGLYLRSARRGYGFCAYGDELPEQRVEDLQRMTRAYVLFVRTGSVAMPPMNRTLRGVQASGIPVVALWLVGDDPCPSPARDRRESEARIALDAAGIDADLIPALPARRVNRESLEQLGELLDELFSRGVQDVIDPVEIAVRAFHRFADERRWEDAQRAFSVAYARNGKKPIRPSLVAAAVRALQAEPFSITPLQVLAHAKDPSTIEPLLAFLRSIYEPGYAPGATVAFVCELLFALGERRHESIAWEAYANAVDPLRKEFESIMRKVFGRNLLPVIEARLEPMSPADPLRPAFEKLCARWRRSKARVVDRS
jgi:hypothetical protein